MIAGVAAQAGVAQVQLVITEYAARGSTLEVLVVPARDAADDLAGRVRAHILTAGFGGPSTAFHRDPEALRVRLVEDLIANERTGKTSGLIQRQSP
jgi:hypothetical protein